MVRFYRKNRTGASETTAVEGDEHHMLPLHFLESLVPTSQRRNHMRVEHDDGDEDYHGVRGERKHRQTKQGIASWVVSVSSLRASFSNGIKCWAQ